MIRFACKVIDKQDIVRCAFDLNKTEYNVLVFFFKNPRDNTAKKVSDSIGLERTTVQKAFKKLLRKKIIKRKKKNLEKGGYIFLYELNDKNIVKKRIKDTISEWYKNAIRKIDDI